MTAKPVRPLLSRQFTAAVAAGPGGGRDQQASRSGDAHKGDGSYAHNDAAALVHRRGIRLRAVSAGEPCPGCSSCRGPSALGRGAKFKSRLPPFRVFFMDIFLFSTDQRQLRPGPAGRQPARGRDGWEGNLGHRTGLLAHGGGCARGRLCGAWRTHQGRICATLPWRDRQPEGALVLADGGVSCQAHVG